MSVVNKMLKDLDARQSQPDEISADYHAPQKKQSRLLPLILLILATVAIILSLADKIQLFSETKKSEVSASIKALSLAPAAPAKIAVLTHTNRMHEQVKPQIASAIPSQSEVDLLDTETAVASISDVLAIEPVLQSELDISTDDTAPLQDTETQAKQLKTKSSTELDIKTEAEQTSSFSMTGSRQNNNTSSLRQRIAESLNNDNLDLAQLLLQELLKIEPDNIKARKKLASLLFAQGNYARSKQLLVQSIELHPTQSDLRLMLARLYVVQKDTAQAINVLTEVQPSTNTQTEYLAYRAALAQQLKQTKLARTDYKALTIIEADNAKWWLGLAIAEDQLGEMDMALQAYNKASSLGQLNVSVNNFVQQRIIILASAQ
jgi:MSHA biogenesis protein MshN